MAANAADYAVIGVDVQRLLRRDEAAVVRQRIVPESPIPSAGWNEEDFLTLGFSAKESLFKALSCDVGKIFGFECARLTGVFEGSRVFELRLTQALTGHWTSGTTFVGRYHVADGCMMTVVGI